MLDGSTPVEDHRSAVTRYHQHRSLASWRFNSRPEATTGANRSPFPGKSFQCIVFRFKKHPLILLIAHRHTITGDGPDGSHSQHTARVQNAHAEAHDTVRWRRPSKPTVRRRSPLEHTSVQQRDVRVQQSAVQRPVRWCLQSGGEHRWKSSTKQQKIAIEASAADATAAQQKKNCKQTATETVTEKIEKVRRKIV